MRRRVLAGIGLLFLACVLTSPQVTGDDEKKSAGPFGLARVWAVHLDIPAAEYQAMQPAGGMGFFGPPPKAPPAKRDDGRPREKNLFGLEFPWAHGDLTADGVARKKVGLRYAGDGTYFAASRGLRRPLRVELSRFADQNLHGLTALNLHAGALDPTRAREALAFAVFRAAGVPAPRTAFAEVTLTVPSRYAREHLGLYTVVEDVDQAFLRDRFKTDKGLLLRPERMQGLAYLGEEWEKYKGQYQPRSEATKEQAGRVIAFARLIQQADDKQFRAEVGSYLDIDAFLRFLAANALVANTESFFALGHNYYLYLHPTTNRFHFLPGDLELSLANFLLMGSADQLMDMSLTQPYPGPNRLADRLLADKAVREKYREILKELASTCFTKERLLKDLDAVEKAVKEPLAREAKATAARKEAAGGFGPPPPPLRRFVERRTASVAAQLTGKSKGYVPRFAFGPPGGAAPAEPVTEKTVRDILQPPPEFDVTLFAAPPLVNYPVTVAAAPTGEVFVAVDEQGSLGRTPGGGKVLRCLDRDGKADKVTVFARMEHPRGLVAHGRSVWVMHPPTLSVYHDDDGDGVADRSEVLVTGLTTDMITKRGGDHTTNGIRQGIDGWIYIGVGDYGIREAKGKDGSRVTLRGGGVVRVRPDGTDLEVFAVGLRNPFDLAIDPYLNLFTRDNTNDGAGWDERVSHLVQTANYGYTQLYANFTEETMPPLGSFGQGGGTGALFVEHPQWPARFRDTLYTGDWGRSEVYRHPLRKNGATFDLEQEVFLKVPRATGMDLDAGGRLYVASWRGGEASVFVGPNVGFIARVAPRGLKPSPLPNFKDAGLEELTGHLAGPGAAIRQCAQREFLRRGRSAEATRALVKLASDTAAPLPGRVAAVFTLKQLDGKDSREALVKLAADAAIREFALRALTDRKGELAGLDARPFVAALADQSPRVRAQAVISLSRLGDPAAAKHLVPLTSRPAGSAMPTRRPVQAQPDPDRVVPHLAVRALVSLSAAEECVKAVEGPHRDGALLALRSMHDERAVEGLIRLLATARAPEMRRGVLATLIRLYHREADYDGSWWGIRPDNTGPYYDRREWALSKRIGSVVTNAVRDADAESAAFLRRELARHKVALDGLPAGANDAASANEAPVVIEKADPTNPNQIGNMTYEAASRRALAAKGDAARGKALFKSQSCAACHTDADGQTPKGPHLVDIGKRYKADELVESILKPSEKLAQGFEGYTFTTTSGRVVTGFVVTEGADAVRIREATGVQRELKKKEIEGREMQKQSMMPEGLVARLTPEQLADLIAYLQSLR